MHYKASKAWHFSHQLALQLREVLSEVDTSDDVAVQMAARLKRASTKAPNVLAGSVEKQLEREKLKCYRAAKAALEDVHWHLRLALRLQYIDKELFGELEKLLVTAHRELSGLAIPNE